MLLQIASSVILSSKISLVNKNKFKAPQRTKRSVLQISENIWFNFAYQQRHIRCLFWDTVPWFF